MLGWLFKREAPPVLERRGVPAMGYTAQVMAARESYIAGRSGLGELTAAVQTAVALWEAGFALADVAGTALLSRASMALLARSAALRGEAVMLIREAGLVPAADWDIATRDGTPRAYRVSVPEAGGARSETVLAGEVIHLRLAADPVAPWTGQPPLRRAALSASLLHEVETAIRDVFREAPIGSQIVPLPDSSADDMAAMRAAFRGRRGATLVVEGVAQATAAGMNPQLGQRREELSPDLDKAQALGALAAARDAIFAAFGVLPGLHNPATTGPLVREAQRHLAQWTLQPMAQLLAEEATAKLGSRVSIDVVRPLQAFDAGGRARAFAAMVAALTAAKDAGLDPQAVEDALSFIDWE